MSDSFVKKIFLVVIYLIIIVMIIFFLDYLFRLTVRKKRKMNIKKIAQRKALDTNKSLVIFNDRHNGIVKNISQKESTGGSTGKVKGNAKEESSEEFSGDMVEIINQMADNSCVIIVSQTLEYIDESNNNNDNDNGQENSLLSKTIEQLKRVSGGDIYFINIDKNSPRAFFDYKIKNFMDKSYYVPGEEIKWNKPNELQVKTQKFYSYIFKIIPYKFITHDPVENIKK